MTRSKADRHATEARDDEIKGKSPYPATRAQAQQRLAITRSKIVCRAKEARDDGLKIIGKNPRKLAWDVVGA